MLRGGEAIAAGSDGCVFDGTFAPDGTFTKDPTKVTKVFTPERKSVADNEWTAMELVMNVTNGNGVVVAEGPPQPIAKVTDDAWENGKIDGSCEALKKLPDPSPGITGLVLPRIDGTMLDLYLDGLRNNRRLVLTAASFPDITEAVGKLNAAGIVHMDFAVRNIFYKNEGGVNKLLIGDFGNAFQIGDDIDDRVKTYIKRYNLGGAAKFLACTKVDGVHPLAVAVMIIYNAFLAGEVEYEALLTNIRTNNFPNRCQAIAEATWVSIHLRNLASRDPTVKPAVDDFIALYASKLKTILNIFADPGRNYNHAVAAQAGIVSILQKNLKRSDKCLLDLMVLVYQGGALSEESVRKLAKTWFPPPPPKNGGRKQRGGEKLLEEAASLEEALAQADPELVNDSTDKQVPAFSSLAEGLAQLEGGDRKVINKTRRKRVKMSRRR